MSDSKIVSKSRASIHYVVSPGTKLTTTAVKTLYVFTYHLQSMAREFTSAAEFNEQYGTGFTEIIIPKYELNRHTVGATGGQSRNYKILDAVIDELKELELKWDNQAEEGAEDRGFERVFPGIRQLNGDVIFKISAEARAILVDERTAALIDFPKVNESFSSTYAIFLNEAIEEKMYMSSLDAACLDFTDAELRKILKVPYVLDEKTGQPVFSYQTTSSFKAKVVKPAKDAYNKAEMNFHITDADYSKEDGVWFFEMYRRKPAELSRIAKKHPDEFLKISTFLRDIKLKKEVREQIESSIVTKNDVDYLMYCIKVVQEKSSKITKSVAGYFIQIYENNREAFERERTQILAEQKKEREQRRLMIRDNIAKQNQQFREQYIKVQRDTFRNAVASGKVPYSDVMEPYKAFLKKSLMISSFKDEYAKLTESSYIDTDSQPFKSFVAEFVEINEDDCKAYVSVQTKTLRA